MRDRVRKWGRKYPLFDAIDLGELIIFECLITFFICKFAHHDQISLCNNNNNFVAVSDNGFKLMCLLYLTPVLPLSIVSYLLGTTSMQLYKFAAAKIAAVPLMLMYVFIGASTDMLISAGTEDESITGSDSAKTSKKISVDDETHRKMVLIGICLSVVSMSLVSHFVKKQLNEVRVPHFNKRLVFHFYYSTLVSPTLFNFVIMICKHLPCPFCSYDATNFYLK